MPEGLRSWVIGADSLTRRLQGRCGREFRVVLRDQRWQRPEPSERAILGLADRAWALVRQVHLFCGRRAVVFARTVMPDATLRGARRRFARLGNRPLGALLFSDRTIVRGELEVALIEPGHALHRSAALGLPAAEAPGGPIWGRRSVFLVESKPLLVSEIFLPPIVRLDAGRDERQGGRGSHADRN